MLHIDFYMLEENKSFIYISVFFIKKSIIINIFVIVLFYYSEIDYHYFALFLLFFSAFLLIFINFECRNTFCGDSAHAPGTVNYDRRWRDSLALWRNIVNEPTVYRKTISLFHAKRRQIKLSGYCSLNMVPTGHKFDFLL